MFARKYNIFALHKKRKVYHAKFLERDSTINLYNAIVNSHSVNVPLFIENAKTNKIVAVEDLINAKNKSPRNFGGRNNTPTRGVSISKTTSRKLS